MRAQEYVLIVAEEAAQARVIAAGLAAAGYAVIHAADGSTALALLRLPGQSPPALRATGNRRVRGA